MRWYGPTWHAPVNMPEHEAAVPVGEPCMRCGIAIAEGDRGFLVPHLSSTEPPVERPFHHECMMAETLGPDWRKYVRDPT